MANRDQRRPILIINEDIPIEEEVAKSSAWQASMNIFRGNIGSGILGLPFAFLNSGLWAGMIGLPIVCMISLHCSKLLIDCKRKLQEIENSNYSYGDIAYQALGAKGAAVVNFLISFTQIGFCCSYVIFISKNMNIVVPQVSALMWALFCLPILCFLCCQRSLKYLAPFSLFANFTLLFGIGVVLYHSIARIIENPHPLEDIRGVNWSKLPIFFGMAVYCYEGIGLVVPIESSMKNPNRYLTLLFSAMATISLLLISFGSIGYIAYGENTPGIITTNLPDDILTLLVRIFISFSLLMTFPVQLFPVVEMIEGYFFKVKTPFFEHKRNLMRIALVFLATFAAISIPHFGLVIGLIGSLGSSSLSFIVPSTLHLRIFGDSSRLVKAKNVGIALFGIIGGIAGTVITLMEIVEVMGNPFVEE